MDTGKGKYYTSTAKGISGRVVKGEVNVGMGASGDCGNEGGGKRMRGGVEVSGGGCECVHKPFKKSISWLLVKIDSLFIR